MAKYSDYVIIGAASAKVVAEVLHTQYILRVEAGTLKDEEACELYKKYINEQIDIIMTTANLLVDAGVLERDVESVVPLIDF